MERKASHTVLSSMPTVTETGLSADRGTPAWRGVLGFPAVKVVPPASLTVMDCAQGKLWRMWSRYILTEGTSASFNPRSLMCATSCPM